ncbi:RnfABCDGE type electron transport complex subunit B [Anaerobranca gottschalkii]|uniref:Ion-translocating oxidoreductase complex subunit B n=1 Tax=Anaerobranca gottschalkii DSM 13577 TaxID=1120990 RepID=A0A1H9YB35_9FIRM|nr:RnfABCDGE type electron transport complex subunit B [Anaerobranca gottschalkii]SES65675.1 electron transport complex, RnfABCDGE type, B subunit [Anaerobranca gottschalkii DSM 13577]
MIIPILVIGGIGVVFGTMLAIASVIFAVEVDPRVDAINEILPGANCGACGYPGCGGFAEAVVGGKAPITGCPVGRQKTADKIAEIMGIEAKSSTQDTKMVARVICNGTSEVAKEKFIYDGVKDCVSAMLIDGGSKACKYGCLGLATCVRECPFDAITMGENGIPVIDEEICTSCQKCVIACPKDVIRMVPQGSQVHVLCNSIDKGASTMKVCKVGCIGCRKCAKVCPEQCITVENNLAVIDNFKCTACEKCIGECPTNAIKKVQ